MCVCVCVCVCVSNLMYQLNSGGLVVAVPEVKMLLYSKHTPTYVKHSPGL